jgi:signal transduction histidine kinase
VIATGLPLKVKMPSTSSESALILVVVADSDLQSQLRLVLQSGTHRVVEVQDCDSCISLLQDLSPSLALIDVDLIECDPNQSYPLLRNLVDANVSVLLLAGSETQLGIDQVVSPMLFSEQINFIRYPLEQGILAQRVKQMLQISALHQKLREQQRLYQHAQERVEDLEHLDRLKDEFLSTVIHELRTPLTNMKVASQLVEVIVQQVKQSIQDHPSATLLLKTSTYLQTLRNECEREKVLINNLLDLQHLEAGVYPLELAPIDLQSWIPRVTEAFQDSISAHQQTLTVNVTKHLPPLVSSLMSLERVINELLHNACKYTPAGERIQVTAEKSANQCIQLVIRNWGVEIPESKRAQVFEKFYRVPGSDHWKQGGSGLGLALVSKLVSHLGGSIELQSGSGQTAFMIQLPIDGPQLATDLQAS